MTTPLSPSQATDLCHCGHTVAEHDVVATRYCRVTLSEALPRSCTCPVGPSVLPRSYDRR
jgi:hypothetical protein